MIRTLPSIPPPRTNFRLGGRHRAGRTVEPSRGLEPEVLAQAALFTIAGGAWSPAVAATGRTVGSGRGGYLRESRERGWNPVFQRRLWGRWRQESRRIARADVAAGSPRVAWRC